MGLAKGREMGLAKGREEGVLLGRAESILRILAARDVQVEEWARLRILTCKDLATLDRWLSRSINATSLSVLFGEQAQ
ncbi:hypothetical protein HPC49_35800 [Pyxidicoccus fallax]|nr:hypothetical protein [Pyxidicoccus fallax]